MKTKNKLVLFKILKSKKTFDIHLWTGYNILKFIRESMTFSCLQRKKTAGKRTTSGTSRFMLREAQHDKVCVDPFDPCGGAPLLNFVEPMSK